MQFIAEGAWLKIRRGRGPSSVPARSGPLPGMAYQDPDGCCIRRHSCIAGWGRETVEPASEHPGRDRQLYRWLCKDDGVWRTHHCCEEISCLLIPE